MRGTDLPELACSPVQRSSHSCILGRSAARESSRLMKSDKLIPSRAARALRTVYRVGYVPNLDHFGHASSIQACRLHVLMNRANGPGLSMPPKDLASPSPPGCHRLGMCLIDGTQASNKLYRFSHCTDLDRLGKAGSQTAERQIRCSGRDSSPTHWPVPVPAMANDWDAGLGEEFRSSSGAPLNIPAPLAIRN